MANIIENKKIRKIVHRFDTAENWKKSNVQLLPGEIAFDEEGNFKVGLNQSDSSWRSLPFAGKAKFVSGTLDQRPSVLDGKSYGVGDIFKDTTSKKWYFLTGFNEYGEYIWDELTFGSHDLDSIVEGFEAELKKKANILDIEELRIELADKVNNEDLQNLVTQDELSAVGKKTEGVIDSVEDLTRRIDFVDNDILEIYSKFDSTVSSEDLHDYVLELNEKVEEKIAEKANQTALDALSQIVNEKADLATVEDNFTRQVAFNSLFDETEELKVVVSEKVDKTHLFDDNGIIRSSLLPGSVDDIVEGGFMDGVFVPADSNAEINVGGKLYLDIYTKILYRWTGTQYVSVSSGNATLVLGTTTGTAYEGSSGKVLEDTIITIQGNVENISSQLNSQNDRIITNATEISKISATLESQSKSIDDVKDSIKTQNTKIDDVQKDVNDNARKLQSHADSIGKITQLESRVKAVEDENSKQKNSIETNANTLKTYDRVLTEYDSRIQRLENTSGQSNDLTSVVDELKTKVTTLEYNDASQNTIISNLTSSVANNSSEISTLQADVIAQNQSISSISSDLSKQDEQLKDILDDLTDYSSRIVALETSDKTQKEILKSVASSITEHGEKISSLETSREEHKNRLDKQSAYITSHEKRLDKLESSIGDNIVIPDIDLSSIIDENGLIKSSLLPGYVDDVIEGTITEDGFIPTNDSAEVAVSGKLYVDTNTKEVYRWSGTQYVKISSGSSLILGTTTGTAYEGSAGKLLDYRVTELEGRVSSTESDITNINSNIEELTEKNADIESSITEISNNISDINSQLSIIPDINSSIKELTEKKLEQDSKISSLETSVGSLEDSINVLSSDFSDIENDFITANAKVESFEDYLDGHDDRLNDLSALVEQVLTVTVTTDNTAPLQRFAFVNELQPSDIPDISITKLILDDELELDGGDASD